MRIQSAWLPWSFHKQPEAVLVLLYAYKWQKHARQNFISEHGKWAFTAQYCTGMIRCSKWWLCKRWLKWGIIKSKNYLHHFIVTYNIEIYIHSSIFWCIAGAISFNISSLRMFIRSSLPFINHTLKAFSSICIFFKRT